MLTLPDQLKFASYTPVEVLFPIDHIIYYVINYYTMIDQIFMYKDKFLCSSLISTVDLLSVITAPC